jgi:putative transposase
MPPKEHRSATRLRRNERGIWQRHFWERTIRNERDYAARMDYFHFNRVKHGLADSAAGWQ